MGVKIKNNDMAASALSNAIPKKSIELRQFPVKDPEKDPVIIPGKIFRILRNHFKELPSTYKNVFFGLKEYPVENINDRVGRTRSDPTHLVIFCVRCLLTDEYNPLGLVHINMHLEYADQLALLWEAFIQDLSKLELNVVASVSPCTQMYRDVLAKLTRNPNFENCSLPITYQVYPFNLVHLYDYNSIMEEFQDAFHQRMDLCFVSRPWADSNSMEQVYAASWRDIFGAISPSLGKASYNFLDKLRGLNNLIFAKNFRDNYKKVSLQKPNRSFTKLSTDFLLGLLWEFSRISEVTSMIPEELERFCVENQELKYMLASAHFKPNNYNKIHCDNTWFSTFENNADLNIRSNPVEFHSSIVVDKSDKGEKAFWNYVNRLVSSEEYFIEKHSLKLLDKESTATKFVREFAETEIENQEYIETSEYTSNLVDKTNPCVALNNNDVEPIKPNKKSLTAPKNIENPILNEDIMRSSYETSDVSDTVHYLDHILSPSKERIKNYLDTFGYSKDSYDKLYSYEHANNPGKMSKKSQIDKSSKETGDATSDQKSKTYIPYKKSESGQLFKKPTVEKSVTEIQSKLVSNKPVKNPNCQVPAQYPRNSSKLSKEDGFSEAASELTLDKSTTEVHSNKTKNSRKTAYKEPAKNIHNQKAAAESAKNESKMSKVKTVDFNDASKCLAKTKVSKEKGSDKEASMLSIYTNYLINFMENQSDKLNNCEKSAPEKPAKNQSNEASVNSSKSDIQMSKYNDVNFKEGESKKAKKVTVNENATKDSAGIARTKNQTHNVPVESCRKTGTKIYKNVNVDSSKTFSDPLAGKRDATSGLLNKPISKVHTDKNATEMVSNKSKSDPVFEKSGSKKVSNIQESSKMTKNINAGSKKGKPKSMSLKNEIMQLDLILQNSGPSTEHQPMETVEGPSKTEYSKSTSEDQMKKGQISADSGYSSTTSLNQALMSVDQPFLSIDQAIEVIKNKQKVLENNELGKLLLTDPTQKKKNGKTENGKPIFSDRRRKEGSCQQEISQVIFKAMEKMGVEPKPNPIKGQKTDNLEMLAELATNCEIAQNKPPASKSNQNIETNMLKEKPSTADSKNAKQSNISNPCQDLTEKEDKIDKLCTKDAMDNFFECFAPKQNQQKNNVSLSFLQNIFFSSASYNMESTSADVQTRSLDAKNSNEECLHENSEALLEIFLDPGEDCEEDNIYSGIVPETNNEESLQQDADNDKIEVMGVEEYRQLLLSDCDKQQRTCDIINVKDKGAVINFFNIIPEGAEVLQITTDWLCTLKGYSKLKERLKQLNIPSVYTNALGLDYIDLFVGLIRRYNTDRSLGLAYRFSSEDLIFFLIDREGTFDVIERAGPGSGRFLIKQDPSKTI